MKLHIKMPRPIVGWPLVPAIALEKQAPGFIVKLLEASSFRRQTVFAVLARVDVTHVAASAFLHEVGANSGDGSDDLAEPFVTFANTLCIRKCRDLVRAAYGPFNDGLMGALGRIGSEPLDTPEDYLDLATFFANEEHRGKARTLRHVRSVSTATVAVLKNLDPLWTCNSHIVDICAQKGTTNELNEALNFIRVHCTAATDDALRQSVRRIGPDGANEEFFQEWFRRADRFPPGPELKNDKFRPLASAEAMIDAGRRFRNCLATKICDVLLGRYFYLEWLDARGAIVELRPLSDGRSWLREEIYGHNNSPLPRQFRNDVRRDIRDAGIFELINVREDFSKDALTRTFGLETPLDWLI
ncbi:hypothetical protein H2509_02530 [Stappia sp. F7233]|uniref:Uncharacterized protein n=1 Tax=Stappia albiluteola TaxID=2758565 RepID=A0A839AAR5_9HYPH|nr:hypothetical protein [Stappia albiluteola]MBA5775997.1 hypothetical protein [Stappia albiluteola]